MKPRKADRDALVTLLESGDYEDVQSLADAVWELVLKQLPAYSSYGLRIASGEAAWACGPFWSIPDARESAKKWINASCTVSLHNLDAPGIPRPEEPPYNPLRPCECGHGEVQHVDKKWRPAAASNSSTALEPGCGVFIQEGKKKVRCPCRKTYGHFLGGKPAWKEKGKAA